MENNRLNVKFEPIPETLLEPFSQDFPFFVDGLVRGGLGGCVLTPACGQHAQKLYNFNLRPDDIWILSFPKSGTTWTQELVWLVANDCDFNEASAQLLSVRSPFLEFPYLRPVTEETFTRNHLEHLEQMKSPRLIKSHLPFHLLPPHLLDTCKVIYVARNPKDVIVSYYYHHKLVKFTYFTGDIQCFARHFMQDRVRHAPYFPHVLEAWKCRNHPNVLFLFYEHLIKDLRRSIVEVARFLDKSLNEDQLDQLTHHLQFESLSKNPSVNKEENHIQGFYHEDGRFFRKGQIGDWMNYFDAHLTGQIDEWIQSNIDGTDLSFVEQP